MLLKMHFNPSWLLIARYVINVIEISINENNLIALGFHSTTVLIAH